MTDANNVTAFRIDDVSVKTNVAPAAKELVLSGGFEPVVTGWTKTGAADRRASGYSFRLDDVSVR